MAKKDTTELAKAMIDNAKKYSIPMKKKPKKKK